MSMIYTTTINVDTLEIKRHSFESGYYDDPEDYGYASYNEDGFKDIYAESLVSQDDADQLCVRFAIDLRDKLNRVINTLGK